MADTLAEIYNDTLVESDFNSSGEATIITTDSSTAHVIKNVQIVEGDSNIKVNGTLDVNGFDIVGLTANSSGSEIVAPSSTVKVKSTGFPLSYEDDEFNVRNSSGGNYISSTVAKVNDYVAIEEIYDSTNNLQNPIQNNDTTNVFAPFIGANDYHYMYVTNGNSTTTVNIYSDSTGSSVYSHSTNYTPKWWDGEQYAYYYQTSFPTGINRIDVAAGTSAIFKAGNWGSPSSDPKMFGYEDEYLWFWANKSETGYVYDFSDGSVKAMTDGLVTNVYGSWADGRVFYAVKRSNGSYRFIKTTGSTGIRYLDWSPGDVHTSSTSYTDIALQGNEQHFREHSAGHSVVGSKFYYINNDSEKLAYWDFDPDVPTHKVIGTNQFTESYGMDLTYVKRTPSSATISGRSYGISPSLKIRMSGVTST